ncbi:hypothetical protein Clacol_002615 [Clathrus columnatus]|uniref:Uncharacterized protein n=1 Tax=Clathrus columnatus TaxID=1419009 RepID=A0AAV5A1A8_9AGAM|nr:hypothetical protein Clacol_002615 [Clathrus columnatus]
MIITYSSSHSKSTSTQPRPSYGAAIPSTEYRQIDMGRSPTSAEAPLLGPPPYQLQEKPRKSFTCLRFFKAFLIALGLYLAISYIMHRTNTHIIIGDEFELLNPLPADGDIMDCFPPNASSSIFDVQDQDQPMLDNDYDFKEYFSYSIPSSSKLIYFLSRGNLGYGSLQFVLADDAGDNVKVDVVARYSRRSILDKSRICHLTRNNNNEQGIGFFTPQTRGSISSRDMVHFTVTIQFPRNQNSVQEPLLIQGLDTKMGIWGHSLFLDNLVRFNQINLHGSNSPIVIKNVLLENADISTTNSPITGSFTIERKTTLKTSNARIDVDVTMINRDGTQPTIAKLSTSNGAVTAPITLVSKGTNSDQPSAFDVSAKTSNAPLTLSFPDAPIDPFSILNLFGSTSNAPVKTTLHPTYEGNILLQTSVFGPSLEQSYASDPSGQGRDRIIYTQRTRGKLSSDVKWGENSTANGHVSLKTSNSPNTLYL